MESWLAERHRGEAVHGDPVDVFGWADGLKGCAFIDVSRHRMLQQNAIDSRVSRQIPDLVNQFGCGRGDGKFDDDRADTVLLTTSTLHRDIGPRPRIIADQHCGQHRLPTRLVQILRCAALRICEQRPRHRCAIHDLRAHTDPLDCFQ